MAMKKNISKALAMAVMMSLLAGGSAYAEVIIKGEVDDTNATAGYNSQSEIKVKSQFNSVTKTATLTSTGLFFDNNGQTINLSGSGLTFAKDNSLGIHNLADGVNPNDAVNKGQMDKALAQKANQADLDAETTARKDADADLQKQIDAIGGGSSAGLNELNNKINQTNDRVDRVGATAAALAGIHYQPMAKGQSQVAIGMGGYKGKKATALGLAYQISDRVSGSVAGAANGSERMFNVGFNYLFGQHSDKDIVQCAAVPGSVSLKEAELQSEVDSLKAHIAKQDAEMAELKAMVKALAAK